MAQFVALTEGVEVSGDAVLSVVLGLGSFSRMALKLLAEHGIVDPHPGEWYSQQAWLDTFKVIAERIGPTTLRSIGKKIPETAQWPPGIDAPHKALASIDVAYHMNHRLNGRILFDPQTNRMREGIGHYAFEETGERSARMVCDNPYPCEFDAGIIEAVAKKFKPKDSLLVQLTHDETAGCRAKGGESCTYLLSW